MTSQVIKLEEEKEAVRKKLLPIMDTMELLSGKWKVVIMTVLYLGGKMRFNEIKRMIPKITPRMLSKELKFLEEHDIVSRNIKASSNPIVTEYELTEYGLTLDPVFKAITEWGVKHRKHIMKK
ncbi:MAG: helix-turn-helix domain-containing protein [Bacteroidota bacterium]